MSAGPVVHDHDGGLDDLLSLLLLSRYGVDLRGVLVTPADCLPGPAASASSRLLAAHGPAGVPVAVGDLPAVHPFPMAWRTDALRIDALPGLNRDGRTPDAPLPGPGHEHLAGWLRDADEPVTVLATGPVTHLARVLDDEPDLVGAVGRLVFTGGALDVPGNVDEPGHDGSAEWNVYWDAPSLQRVLDHGVPTTLFPLDVTGRLPVTADLARELGRGGGEVADLAAGLCAMTLGTLEVTGMPYCFWDSLAASHLAAPELCTFADVGVRVETAGPSEGRTVADPAGAVVQVAVDVDVDGFAAHLVRTLARA